METIFNILSLCHWLLQFLNFPIFSPFDINDKGFLLIAPLVDISPPEMLLFLLFVHYKEINPNLCIRCSNASLGSGLVNISTICSLVSIYSNLTTSWDTWSLLECYFIGMCFVLDCMTEFFDIFMALVLSPCMKMGSSYFTSKSSNISFIQMTCVQNDTWAIYLDSIVDSEMEDFFLVSHDTNQYPRQNVSPLVFFLSSVLPSQSALVNDFRVKLFCFGYHNP